MAADAFSPSTWDRGRRNSEFEASLVYRSSARTGSKAREKPCLKNHKKEKKLAPSRIETEMGGVEKYLIWMNPKEQE